MEDGVMGALPALIGEALLGLPVVLDEAVAVPVAVGIDPPQGRLRVGPQRAHQFQVARAHEIFTEQQNEQRSGVDAPVVAAEWNLMQIGHLAMTHLMQYLAGFGIARSLAGGRLVRSQKTQNTLRDARIDPQRHQSGDESVAAEGRAEPRRARVRIVAMRRVGDEHVQIGYGAAHYFVEYGVGTIDA